MTMRTRFALICECGHTGTLITSENDQPYSQAWESHKLEGFQSAGSGDSDKSIPHSPRCPECGSTNVDYAPGT